MKNFNDIFNEIKSTDVSWEDKINKYLEQKEDGEINQEYETFLGNISEIYKDIDDNDIAKKELEKYLTNDTLINNLHTEICNINTWFNDVRILRLLEKNNPKVLGYVFESIFNNFILHIDIGELENLSNLFENVECSENELLSCAQALDFISEIYVKSLLSKNLMIKDFTESSGIDKEYAISFVELISKNEMDIKINYLIKNMNN